MSSANNLPYSNPQVAFYQQYEMLRRDEIVGVLLALFLGTFGVHHFYLRRTGLGILYCCFFWSGIPALLGMIECFFMPGRVREYNAIQAAAIAAALGIGVPGWGQPANAATANVPPAAVPVAEPAVIPALTVCPRCQSACATGARFCSGCGQQL